MTTRSILWTLEPLPLHLPLPSPFDAEAPGRRTGVVLHHALDRLLGRATITLSILVLAEVCKQPGLGSLLWRHKPLLHGLTHILPSISRIAITGPALSVSA